MAAAALVYNSHSWSACLLADWAPPPNVVSVVVSCVAWMAAVRSSMLSRSVRIASVYRYNGILAVSILYILLGPVVLVVALLLFLTSWSDGVGSDVVEG